MIRDQNSNQSEAVNDWRQTSQISTVDLAAASKPSIETTQPPPYPVPGESAAERTTSVLLLPTKEIQDLRTQWINTQAGFVDEPRKSVQEADVLVADVMKRLAETFANERSQLEGQWSSGENVSTEDLRVALQHYRSFFDRLIAL
jgi:hypothetical protein